MASGSIRKRRGKKGTTYQVVIELGTVAGKRRQKTATYKRRKDADEYLVKALHELNSGAYIEPSTMPLGEYAPHWFETIDVRASSRVAYQGIYDRHIAPTFGETALGQITPLTVQTWINGKRGRYRSAPGMLIVLQSILKQAVRERLILSNPCADIHVGERATTPPASARIAWSAAQLADFLAQTRDQPDWALWWVAAHTGLRPGELVALRWSDLDLVRRTLHVQRTQTVVSRTGARVIGVVAKTSASNRTIGLDAETVLILNGQRATQIARRRLLGGHWIETDLVFDRGDGEMLNARLVSRQFAREARAYKLPDSGLQILRHTHGSILAISGRPLHYIQHRLGHADIATTSRYYLHLIQGTEHDDAETFARTVQAAQRAKSEAM